MDGAPEESCDFELSTVSIPAECRLSDGFSQTKAVIRVCVPYIEDYQPAKMELYLQGDAVGDSWVCYETESISDTYLRDEYTGIGSHYYIGRFELSGLAPNTKYSYYGRAEYADGRAFQSETGSFTTKGITLDVANDSVNATSFRCEGSYKLGTATFSSEKFLFGGEAYEGNSLLLTGLDPQTDYTVEYVVATEEGGAETVLEIPFTTSALSMENLTPKVVASGIAVVCAATNIDDVETGAGFEWRKVDAPDVVPSNTGTGILYGGVMEGRISNLGTDSYYMVRPYYLSASGTAYYGEWIGFDPGDFSYFEPTVHTYPATVEAAGAVQLRGYVMAGTDEVLEQGFEYWAGTAGGAQPATVRAASAQQVETVLASGGVMEARLDGLQPSTLYYFRAFARTASGTAYGEEQSFLTASGPTGMEEVAADSGTGGRRVVCYYTLDGRQHAAPVRGICIVRYSDGSAEKVFVE